MTGRGRKNYTIKLKKREKYPSYDIIVARTRSASGSRIDCIGNIFANAYYTFVKVDRYKLNNYLLFHNINISKATWKALGVADNINFRKI